MDVRIGVVNTPKEITVELVDDTDVEALVSDVESAVAGDGAVLWLTDVRGRRVGVPAERIQRLDEENYWRMADTGPCGPCSELHIDLTPAGDTKGSLVNADSGQCIEIWNLVFMEFQQQTNGKKISLRLRYEYYLL